MTNMLKQTVAAAIEGNFEKYLDFLRDICAFEARATDEPTIDRMMDYIASFAKSEGFQAVRTPRKTVVTFCVSK